MKIRKEVWVIYKLKLDNNPFKTTYHYIGPAEYLGETMSPLGKRHYKIYLPEITSWNAPTEYVFSTKEAAQAECEERNLEFSKTKKGQTK